MVATKITLETKLVRLCGPQHVDIKRVPLCDDILWCIKLLGSGVGSQIAVLQEPKFYTSENEPSEKLQIAV